MSPGDSSLSSPGAEENDRAWKSGWVSSIVPAQPLRCPQGIIPPPGGRPMTSPRAQARPLAALLLGLLLAPAVSAESPPAAAAADPFRDSIQISVVNLEVFVTDKQGKPVSGLRKEDFTVLEDGKP